MRETGDKTAVVLDRHPLWVEAMTQLLQEAGVEVVAKATDADQAVAAVEQFRPDVLVAGLDRANASEVECIRRAKEAHPELKAVARLTLWDSLKSVRLSLWCERHKKLVSFKAAKSG